MSSSNPPASPGRPSTSLHFIVGEMNGKLDQLVASLLPQMQALRDADTAMDSRLVVVERRQWQQTGALGIIVFIVSAWEIIRVLYL